MPIRALAWAKKPRQGASRGVFSKAYVVAFSSGIDSLMAVNWLVGYRGWRHIRLCGRLIPDR